MVISISKEACDKNKISVDEALLMLFYSNKGNFDKAHDSLTKKGYINVTLDSNYQPNGWVVTKTGNEIINYVILDSEPQQKPENTLNQLATELKKLFPTGKKPGTNYYWADGVPLIEKRLKLFFKKYGKDYTNDQIIEATKKYVQSFNGDYQYMKLLKYFICKDKINKCGELESESDLLSYIENAGQDDLGIENNNDWTTTLK